jgi:hypothetical protein
MSATGPVKAEPADDYYYRRAEAELNMAQAATAPAAVKAHYELANLYLERLANPKRHGRSH